MAKVLTVIRATHHSKKKGMGRMTPAVGNLPSLVGEGPRGIGLDDTEKMLRDAQRYGMLRRAKWKSCPHCRCLGFLALFINNGLTSHLRDHVLARRLQLPPPIPERAIPLRQPK